MKFLAAFNKIVNKFILLNEVDEYYQHPKYVIDPCKFKFSKVLRILSLIKRFIKIL